MSVFINRYKWLLVTVVVIIIIFSILYYMIHRPISEQCTMLNTECGELIDLGRVLVLDNAEITPISKGVVPDGRYSVRLWFRNVLLTNVRVVNASFTSTESPSIANLAVPVEISGRGRGFLDLLVYDQKLVSAEREIITGSEYPNAVVRDYTRVARTSYYMLRITYEIGDKTYSSVYNLSRYFYNYLYSKYYINHDVTSYCPILLRHRLGITLYDNNTGVIRVERVYLINNGNDPVRIIGYIAYLRGIGSVDYHTDTDGKYYGENIKIFYYNVLFKVIGTLNITVKPGEKLNLELNIPVDFNKLGINVNLTQYLDPDIGLVLDLYLVTDHYKYVRVCGYEDLKKIEKLWEKQGE